MPLVSWSIFSCIMSSDAIMRVPVLGGPWAVGLTHPALLAASLSIVTDLVMELTALSSTRAVALGSISTRCERFVVGTKTLTIGAFHVVLCAGIEPDFCHGAISTRWFSFTFAHWRGVIRGILCVLPSRSVVYGLATISTDWTGAIVTEMTPALG